MELIVHSHVTNGNELVHNIQSDNLARLKQSKRLLLSLGYDVLRDVHSERGFHSVMLWSFEDRPYTQVPLRTHTAVLRLLKIPVNNIATRLPHIISTYANVQHSRTRSKHRRPSSPVRF